MDDDLSGLQTLAEVAAPINTTQDATPVRLLMDTWITSLEICVSRFYADTSDPLERLTAFLPGWAKDVLWEFLSRKKQEVISNAVSGSGNWMPVLVEGLPELEVSLKSCSTSRLHLYAALCHILMLYFYLATNVMTSFCQIIVIKYSDFWELSHPENFNVTHHRPFIAFAANAFDPTLPEFNRDAFNLVIHCHQKFAKECFDSNPSGDVKGLMFRNIVIFGVFKAIYEEQQQRNLSHVPIDADIQALRLLFKNFHNQNTYN